MLLAPEHIGAAERELIGGKALGLLHIGACGLCTPQWRVLPFAAVAHRVWHGDAALRDALQALLAEYGGHVAVRSSAANEDGAGSSQAGQFHTAFVGSLEQLLHALDTVADAGGAAAMAIVLQHAVEPEFAGVAFSADPSRARPEAMCVEVVPGHGRHLVDGAVTPKRFTLELDGTFRANACPAASAFAPHAAAFAQAMLALEDSRGSAIDVEWAIAGGTLYFLQARPLTALALDPDALAEDVPHVVVLRPAVPAANHTVHPQHAGAADSSREHWRGACDARDTIPRWHSRTFMGGRHTSPTCSGDGRSTARRGGSSARTCASCIRHTAVAETHARSPRCSAMRGTRCAACFGTGARSF
jgi:hypothetical protein